MLTKAPEPGRAKTRLCPPCTLEQAAVIARAALHDTLAAATAVRSAATVLVLDGPPGSWIPTGVRVIPQRGEGLDERIAAAFADAGTPALLIGMDTPQITACLLSDALSLLAGPGVDAVLGEASDGGWWAAGVNDVDSQAFLGVPMGTRSTGRAQRSRFHALGMNVAELPPLRDVDTFQDALAVAEMVPRSRLARAVGTVMMQRVAGGGS